MAYDVPKPLPSCQHDLHCFGARVWGTAGIALVVTIVGAVLVGCGSAARDVHTSSPALAWPMAVSTATAGTLPTPTAPSDPWIPLKSQSADDVLAAVRQAPFLQVVAGAPPGSDGYFDVSHLGTPVLVLAYRVPPHYEGTDYYEVPTLMASNMVDGTIDAQLNAKHTAIYVGSISSSDPAARWPSKLVSPSQANAIVEVQHHTSLRAGARITLMYMATYDTAAVETGQINWNAGGAGPMDPIWLVPGADGTDHFVGTDGRAYSISQLPLTPQS